MMDSHLTRMQRHRVALRARGLRPVQFWVPDHRDPRVIEAAHLACIASQTASHEQEFLREMQDWGDADGWEA